MCPSPTQSTAMSGSSLATAAASRAISPIVEGPTARGELLGTTSRGAWLLVRDHVIVVSKPGQTHLPNGVTVGGLDWPLSQLERDSAVGDGTVRIGESHVSVVRWWDPKPSLHQVAPEVLATSALVASELLPCSGYDPLEFALRDGDNFAIRDSLLDLVGHGPGLTPEGDDVLMGVLAGLRLLGPAVGATWAEDLLHHIESILVVVAPFRTTSLSATLLRHAAAGEVAAPVAEFLQALTGRNELADALDRLRVMGATSGMATACGVLVAARVLTEGVIDG